MEHLREALRRLDGVPITAPIADALVLIASMPPEDRAIPLDTFDVVEHDGYVFRAERLRDIVAELHPLHEAQWQETEGYRHALRLNPDYDAGLLAERNGTLVQFVIRKDDELAGHMRMYVQRSVHTSTRFAQEDTIYLKPEHRTKLLGLAFVRYIERQVVERLGIREIRFDTKHTNRADAILRRLRYEPVATRWVKVKA